MNIKFKYFYNGKRYDVISIDFKNKTVRFFIPEDDITELGFISRIIPYTGKVDRNNIPIFEGDILELRHFCGANCDKHERFLTVEDVDGTGFQLKPFNPNEYGYRHIHRTQYDYTIVGNKYENPELLEVK